MRKRNVIGSLLILLLFAGIAFAAVSDLDLRGRATAPVAIEKVTVTIDVSIDDDEGTATITKNGRVKQIVYTVPDLNGVGTTVNFQLRNADAVAVHTKNTIAENTSTLEFPTNTVYIAGTSTLYVKSSAAQVADEDIVVTLYME